MTLKEWEYVCDKCNGTGLWCKKDDKDCIIDLRHCDSYMIGTKEGNRCMCPKCEGWGKVDFITNIVGKKKVNNLKIWGQRALDLRRELNGFMGR